MQLNSLLTNIKKDRLFESHEHYVWSRQSETLTNAAAALLFVFDASRKSAHTRSYISSGGGSSGRFFVRAAIAPMISYKQTLESCDLSDERSLPLTKSSGTRSSRCETTAEGGVPTVVS